jgi:XTP/dITP diphosphohydrolase
LIFEQKILILQVFNCKIGMKLVFASNNTHKLEEVRQILPAHVEVISLKELGFFQEIEETGETLEDNSNLKAQVVWEWICEKGLSDRIDGVFADDTGLEIAALGGAPGVRTARWAGDEACDVNNRQKALRELQGQVDRSARFRTVVSLITTEHVQQVEGVVLGRIALQEEGAGGFGYDPIVVPEVYEMTFASLSAEEKNAISHRGREMEKLCKILNQ